MYQFKTKSKALVWLGFKSAVVSSIIFKLNYAPSLLYSTINEP
ncbi:hypothetical protein PMAG_a1996 [Pseudoalteromonas mariniglutinosa NCIMB 1770]|nr:hypothetical protein [Pseudoalteromonas mariniglutinosa NCIMB 1770]